MPGSEITTHLTAEQEFKHTFDFTGTQEIVPVVLVGS
jgi:hypothetical protein